MKNRFIIVSPFYNASNTIVKTLNSIKSQDYSNYEVYFVDDMSTDNTSKLIEERINNTEKIKLLRNTEKKYSLKNIYETIHRYSDDEDIIVIVDGDDFLYGRDVLSKLNDYYNTSDCWLTYGSYINLSNKQRGKFSSEIPLKIISSNQFRNYKWCTSHIRTFKSFLFKSIQDVDLKDSSGNFYTITGDLAIMFPMLEMAGKKSLYIDDLLYIWNDMSDLNDHKKDNTLQLKVEKELRSNDKYEILIR